MLLSTPKIGSEMGHVTLFFSIRVITGTVVNSSLKPSVQTKLQFYNNMLSYKVP